MTPKAKILIAAAVAAAALLTFLFWPPSPVEAATKALQDLAERLQIEGDESQIVRTGKSQRLKRAVADPVDIKFRETGREGDWSAEALGNAYLSAAISARSATIELVDLKGEETGEDEVTLVK